MNVEQARQRVLASHPSYVGTHVDCVHCSRLRSMVADFEASVRTAARLEIMQAVMDDGAIEDESYTHWHDRIVGRYEDAREAAGVVETVTA